MGFFYQKEGHFQLTSQKTVETEMLFVIYKAVNLGCASKSKLATKLTTDNHKKLMQNSFSLKI